MKKNFSYAVFFISMLAFLSVQLKAHAQTTKPVFEYTVSMTDAANHYLHVELHTTGWNKDTVNFKMPKWMPGYYQLMDYANGVENLSAGSKNNKKINAVKINDNTWQLTGTKNNDIILKYDVKATRQFVANPFIDATHAYIVCSGVFLYAENYIQSPVSVKVIAPANWKNIATGLTSINGKTNEFTATDFDILYDCPILIGNLKQLPSFYVKGIEHRFIGYKMSDFDSIKFMNNLQKVVTAASDIIGDIPYKQYTFIGIGEGRGGIEHLNNTTVSFDGKGVNTDEGINRTMSFLAHEYFHNYNVKRIRPFELGPFDYDVANKTNLLWVSEGLSVYYEYLAIKRAGIIDEKTLLNNFEHSINAFENDPGRDYQSLVQASYETWSDGPFGRQGQTDDRAISYYDKGPAVGLLLDFAIRNATQNKKSLDDAMRLLYWKYYKGLKRGFTDAEFQNACEEVAGTSLTPLFEYVYTTKELDYNTYLGYAGLHAEIATDASTGKRKITITPIESMNASQKEILQSWLGEK